MLTGYHFKAFLGQKQGQAFGVPVANPHLKIWGVQPGPMNLSHLSPTGSPRMRYIRTDNKVLKSQAALHSLRTTSLNNN